MKTKFNQILTSLLFLFGVVAFAQQTVTGTVTDESGAPIPGASVSIDGTSVVTTTNFDGNYSISASEGDILVVSYVGYNKTEVSVTSAVTDIVLTSSTALEEVVVTGYGTFDKKKFTGSAVTISGDVLSKKNVSNISKALIGEAVGVTVVNTSGQPGTSATVRVRGKIGSINGNNTPLYVLDGVPYQGSINAINPNDIESTTILKDAAATAIYGNRGANGVILITTKRGSADKTNISVDIKTGTNMDYLPRYTVIESPERWTEILWESLKNRGQGLIDAGSASAPTSAVEYANTNIISASAIDPTYNMWNVDGDQLINPTTGKFNDGVTRRYNPERWRDYAFQDSQRNEVNLSISGGSKKSRYYYSVGALEDVGYSIKSNFKRYTTRLNIDTNPNSWLEVRTNLGYSYGVSNQGGQSSDSGSVFWTTANMPSIYPLFERDENGEKMRDVYGGFKYDYGINRGFAGLTNSIADANYNTNKSLVHNFNLNQTFDVKITDELNLESNFSYNLYTSNGDFRSDPFYGSSRGQGGYISKSKGQIISWLLRNALRYQKSVNDNIDIDAYVAYESEKYQTSTLNANKYNLVRPEGLELDNAVVNNTSSSSTSIVTREAFVGFVKASMSDKYFLSADVRRDGTSIFANNKWGTFGSVSAAWILSKEDFFNLDYFDFLKMKLSYGILGESGGRGFYPGYDVFTVENLAGEVSLAFSSKGNPNLTWEAGKQINFGVEFETNILDGYVEVYNKQRDDMFFTQNVGPSVGYRSIIVNDGGLQNQGIEFELVSDLVRSSNFSITAKLQGQFERNKVTAMPIDPATGKEKLFDPSGIYGLAKDHSAYEYYMRDYAGVNPDTGYAQWYRNFDDANGNGTFDTGEVEIEDLDEYILLNPSAKIGEDKVETYTDATKRFLGKEAIPDLAGAFTLSAQYGNFDLSSIFTYQIGGYSYDSAYADFMDNESAGSMQQLHTDIENRWQKPGDVTDVPILNSNWQTNQSSTSSRFLIESDYLSLANLQVGYSLPNSAIETINATSVRLYLSGDNLMTLTKRDGFNPTYSLSGGSGRYTYEPMTTISAGLTVNF